MPNSSDWLSVAINLLIAIGTLAVAIVAIWGDWIRSKLVPPKLRLHLYNPRGEIIHMQGNRDAIYYHLRLVNHRPWSIARNCRVNLRAMHRRSPDQRFYPLVYAVIPQFIWTPSEFTPQTVDLSAEHMLDFGRLVEGESQFQPLLYFVPNNFDGYLKPTDAIRYSLEITADGYKAKRFQVFEVAWNGEWTDNLDKMQHNLVITEILDPDDRIATNVV